MDNAEMWTDRPNLARQYKDPSNLNARCALHERFSTNRTDLRRWLFDYTLTSLPARARILELGCGPGDLWLVNHERIPAGWSITLTDASPGMVAHAAQRLSDVQRQFQFGVADAESLPFAGNSFDAVLAHFMLYHVADRAAACAEIRRVLHLGGALFAATNGHEHLRELRQFAQTSGLTEAWAADDVPAFSLENGEDQLRPWFSTIALHRRHDSLAVTEVEPLVAAMLSSCEVQAVYDHLSDAKADLRLTQLRTMLHSEISKRGAVRIRKDSGLFVAR